MTVGERGTIIGEEALSAGMPPHRVYITRDTTEAAGVLNKLIQRDDIVLVKGSLGARMDRIVSSLSRTKENVDHD